MVPLHEQLIFATTDSFQSSHLNKLFQQYLRTLLIITEVVHMFSCATWKDF